MSKLVPVAQVAYIRVVRGWEPKEMSAVTMLFEGSRQEVAAQRREVCVCLRHTTRGIVKIEGCTCGTLVHRGS